MIRANHQHAGKLGLCAGGRLQRDAVQSGDFFQQFFQVIDELEDALRMFGRLQWMEIGEAGQIGNLFVQLGIVLHGAGAQGVEALVDAEGSLREAREVAHHLKLADFWKVRGCANDIRRKQLFDRGVRNIQGWQRVPWPPLAAQLEYGRLDHARFPICSQTVCNPTMVFPSRIVPS